MKILWMTNHETGYYRHLFENIQAHEKFEVVVAYKRLAKETHPWKQNFSKEYEVVSLQNGLRQLFSSETKMVVIGGWSDSKYILASLLAGILQKNFAIVTDTVKYTSEPRMKVKRAYLRLLNLLNGRFRLLATGKIGVAQAIRLLHLDEKKVLNFPWVTNNELFKPIDVAPKLDNTIELVAVGRLDMSHKGQDITLRAIAMLPEEIRAKIRFHIAGVGRDQDTMATLINELGLEQQVVLTGWLEEHEVVDLIRNAHGVVHSSHFDPYPNCVLEALSCGVPVLGSDAAGSVVDRVVDGENGWVHREGDVTQLAEQIAKLASLSQSGYETMRRKARESALRWPVNYNIEILEQLLLK